jgi:serine/threonine-protein kinase SRPK3
MEKIYDLYGTSNLLLFKEETILDYEPGGYHPVVLGDTLKNGRYKIYHKLGHGGFSTVWVARDAVYVGLIFYYFASMLTNCRREQWVSIKIVKAKWSDQSRELLTLRALSELAKGNLGSKYIVQLLDDFRIEGPNGSHLCLVLELLGPTINITVDDYHQVGERLDAESIVKISTQLLEALTFLHEKGFAHGGIVGRYLFGLVRATSNRRS